MENNKKKLFSVSIAIMILFVFFAVGCGKQNYTRDISYMSKAQKTNEEKLLKKNLDKYDVAKTDIEKLEALQEIGFRYMNLGKLDESISYYEEVLKFDPVHLPALMNLTAMYEEVGEITKALVYAKKLFENYNDSAEVTGDYIRLLVANKQYGEAGMVLDAYSKTEKGKANTEFVNEQLEYIRANKNKK